MVNFKKLKKFVKKVIKPVAIVASILYPPLIPMIGSALVPASASAAVVAAAGSAALSAGASALAGDKTEDILKNAALAGITAGTISKVSGAATAAADSAAAAGANATSSYTGATSAPPPSGMFSAPVSVSSVTPTTTGNEGLFTSSSYTQPIVTSPEGLISPAPSVDVATSIPSITSSVTTTAPDVVKDIASKGLVGDVLKKASEITGISEDILGKLGSAAVSTLISSAGANKIADKATDAARIQADAQIEAARIAAEAAKFRPVGVTTRFGTSNFGYDAEGNLTTAGYTASDEIKNYQDRLKKLADQGLLDAESARAAYEPLTGAAKSLFSLGESYLSKSPEAVAADYISKQQALVSPSRQTQLAELQNKLFQQGRGGAAVSQGGNLMATSPEYAAYYNAIAQQDLALAARADQEARDRISFGSGLFDTGANLQGRYYTGQTGAYAPFAAAMDTSSELENLAARPLDLGIELGGRTTAGRAAGGRFLSEGITSAAATMAPSNAFTGSGEALSAFSKSPEFKSALNNIFGVGSPERTYTAAEVLKLFGT
jgi:trimeric autotransporter adhesin